MVDNESIWAYNIGIVNNKEQQMNEALIYEIPYYGMFTDAGNLVVHSIVKVAKQNNLSFPIVNKMLGELSELEGFEEATDTAVREYVYEAIFGYGE